MTQKVPDPQKVFTELNKLRTNPAAYADVVAKYLGYVNDAKILKIPTHERGIKSKEGKPAFEECVNWLKQQSPVNEVTSSPILFDMAKEYTDLMKDKDPSYANEINPQQLIDKRAMEFGGENEEEVIVNLLVSDGDKERAQRGALMSKEVNKAGIGCIQHAKIRTFTTILLCTKFIDKAGNEGRKIEKFRFSSRKFIFQ